MKTTNQKAVCIRFVLLLFIVLLTSGICSAKDGIDPLPSWNDGITKTTIIDYVQSVVASNDTLRVENRLATFDLDGTIMCEKPTSFQMVATLEKLIDDVRQDPELANVQPWKAAVEMDTTFIKSNYDLVLGTAYKNFTQQAFTDSMYKFMTTETHPVLHRLYCDLMYRPMVELIKYLHENDFRVWICSGSMQGFIRSFSKDYIKIDPDYVIGTSASLDYKDIDGDGDPELFRDGEMLKPVNLKSGKVENIYRWIDKQPLIAFGNSGGDMQMLEYASSHPYGNTLAGIIVHDDKEREFYYRYNDLEDSAKANGWLTVSMKDDFKTVFKPGLEKIEQSESSK